MSTNQARASRGRGRPRGGRGRGLSTTSTSKNDSFISNNTEVHSQNLGDGGTRSTVVNSQLKVHTAQVRKPKLTHFICLPLGGHASLRSIATQFTSSLLSSQPPIEGLDNSIIIPARRLHFTLGVMSLDTSEANENPEQFDATSKHLPSLSNAIELLHHLRPQILSRLNKKPFLAPLEMMDIMRPDRGDPERAHVLWVGPRLHRNDGSRGGLNETSNKLDVCDIKNTEETGDELMAVCKFIQQEFVNAGLMVDEKRPLKLHCTLINTIYRKPRPRNNARTPFSFPGIVASSAFEKICSYPSSSSSFLLKQTVSPHSLPSQSHAQNSENDAQPDKSYSRAQDPKINLRGPFAVQMGTYKIDEIQICEMGSYGLEGEYVSVGSISLV